MDTSDFLTKSGLLTTTGNATDNTMTQNAITQELNNKQDILVSGTNIKTLNNNSLLGSGNLTIEPEAIVNQYTQSTTLGYSANYINNLLVYNSAETVIGTWINSKPLYRMVFYGTSPNTQNNTYLTLSNSFTYNLISSRCSIVFATNRTNTTFAHFANYVNTSYYGGVYGNKSTGRLQFYYRKGNDTTHYFDYVVEVTYTKPTD